jgi:hypothetical protein
LFVIVLFTDGKYGVTSNGPYATMEECFKVREAALTTFTKPKVNYELVCVKSDFSK